MPAFVALLDRRLKVSALIDGAKSGGKIESVRAAARDNEVPLSSIIACSQVDNSLPSTADIEDLFDVEDYLQLYNWAFNTSLSAGDLAQTAEPILRRIEKARGKFDHALPAHALTTHRQKFFETLKPATVARFEKLFEMLNGTLT